MKRVSFTIDALFDFDGRRCRLVAKLPGGDWQAYIAREYPTIVNRYAPAGLPRHVVFDNGLAQWGGTIEQLAFDLDMGISFTRPRHPWFKARVEGMFEVLNRTLLREMPGFVLAKDMHEYDPAVHGCIGLRHFLYILHAWLVDVFMQEPQGVSMQTPAALWEEGTREYPPSFLPRSQDLDLLFGIKRTGRLDHRGVRFANLRYHSPELHALRRQHGDKLAVEVKVDPSNLAFVHARLPNSGSGWVRAEATDLTYAQNLSLHRHQLNQRNAREQFGDDSAASLRKAQDRLHELIAEALPAALSIRSNSLIARALGVGTQHIFNNLNHDGELTGLELANNVRVQACWRRSDVLSVDFRSQYMLPCGRPSTPSQHIEAVPLPARPSGSPRLTEGAIYAHVATGILGTNSSSLRAAVDAGHIRSASRSATDKVLTVVEADVLAFAERFVFTPKLAAELGLSATSVFRNLARLQVSPVWPGIGPVHALWDRRSFDTDVLLGRWVTSSGAMSEQSSLFEL